MNTRLISRRAALTSLAVFFLILFAADAARAVPIVALRNNRDLIIFDSAAPDAVIRQGTVTGTPNLLGIDFRPATGRLYALGSDSRLYVVNLETFAARPVSNSPFSPAVDLSAHQFGFDFNPVLDRARVVGEHGQSLLVDPEPFRSPTGAQADPALSTGGQIITVAYDNNFDGATHTTLFGITRSGGSGILVRIAPATGQVQTVGPTNVLAAVEGGMDIAPVSGVAYAVLKLNSPTVLVPDLYRINLSTGAATLVGPLPSPGFVTDIAVLPQQYVLYAVNGDHELVSFFSGSVERPVSEKPITGMILSEQITDIDFRPATGQLYGLGRTSDGSATHIYVINPATAVATILNPSPISPVLVGEVAMDFDPALDRIRVTSSGNQNIHIRPDDGLVTVQTPLAYAAGDPNAGRDPSPFAMGHSDNYSGAASTTSYVIDSDQCCSARPFLARLGSPGGSPVSPNSGQLFTAGQILEAGLPVDFLGFDIAHGSRGPAFASFISMDDGFSRIYTLDLATGSARRVGEYFADSAPDLDSRRIVELAIAPVGSFEFSADTYAAPEECAALTVTVTRSGDTSNEARVDFLTGDSATAVNPASSRSDYTAAHGTLVFGAGETSKSFSVLVNEDSFDEGGDEVAVVSLTNPSAGHTLGTRRTASVVITDDAAEPSTNAIDDSATFVCQHYHDFLNRQPDAAGLAFWTNNIESCGTSRGCREVKRIDTSAAFFLSGEFQETGYTVVRAHRAAFAHVAAPPFVEFEEFLPDAQRIGRGYVVGEAGAANVLAENKRAFFDEFAMRPEFLAVYGGLTPAQFVDRLNENAASPLSQAERDALVAGLTAGAETRATALRRVVEDADFKGSDRNRAFVLMEYFGYMRRDPDAAGFQFWLDKLNGAGGDFRAAEMVKAFITSGEYRRRFGSN